MNKVTEIPALLITLRSESRYHIIKVGIFALQYEMIEMEAVNLKIKEKLEQLNDLMLKTQNEYEAFLQKVHPVQQKSAFNLLHYLAFRSHDIQDLQEALYEDGFSSLTNSESHIRNQVLAVLKHFSEINDTGPCDFSESKSLLEQRTRTLFGNVDKNRVPSIMVTLKTDHARDFIMVKKFLRSGMNIARINCAHDNEEIWLDIVKNVRRASEITGLPCKIYMDLAGPKIRTKIKGVKKERILLEEDDDFILSDIENTKSDLPVVYTTLSGLAAQLKPGERVFFDDGLFEAKVVSAQGGIAYLEMVRVPSKKPYLKNEKGINFPDSKISLSALTKEDRKSLAFILKHADMVGYSFVHNIPDLMELRNEMNEKKLPIILKIETPEAFYNLPELLLTAMQDEIYGVMIARGDLAVELGFENLSSAQDEIVWICDAAHVPIIWATQVLENLNKTGMPTRSEISDAALGAMAECVMLNKGDYTVQSIKTLRKILQQSSKYRFKKKHLLRPLTLARRFFAVNAPNQLQQTLV